MASTRAVMVDFGCRPLGAGSQTIISGGRRSGPPGPSCIQVLGQDAC